MSNFKIETGIQLLTRLSNCKKPNIEHFYPTLIPFGPKHGEVIELYYSNDNISYLIYDLISQAILPTIFGGVEASVLVFNCGEDFYFESFVQYLQRKLSCYEIYQKLHSEDQYRKLQESLQNLYVLQIFDADQLHTTIHNLEIMLIDYPSISLIMFESLPAFYWTEQTFKVIKMDIYLKHLIKSIQKAVRQYNVSIIYTRHEYFSSSKETLENLEPCCNTPTLERLNYRIHLYQIEEMYQIRIRTHNGITNKQFKVVLNKIEWL